MDDLTEMLTADGECGVRLVVPGANVGWKVGSTLRKGGETMCYCGWNQSILVGLMKQDLYTQQVYFWRKGIKGNQRLAHLAKFTRDRLVDSILFW